MGEVVRPTGFEPMAPRLGIWCSILLSYGRTQNGSRDRLPFGQVGKAGQRKSS